MRKAFLQLHLAVFLAGFTGILGRLITLNEALLVWYRLLIAVLTLWVLYLFSAQTSPHIIGRRSPHYGRRRYCSVTLGNILCQY